MAIPSTCAIDEGEGGYSQVYAFISRRYMESLGRGDDGNIRTPRHSKLLMHNGATRKSCQICSGSSTGSFGVLVQTPNTNKNSCQGRGRKIVGILEAPDK